MATDRSPINCAALRYPSRSTSRRAQADQAALRIAAVSVSVSVSVHGHDYDHDHDHDGSATCGRTMLKTCRTLLYAYLGHLEDAYLLFTVSLHSSSEARKAVHPRKVYLVDHGLARATTFLRGDDTGHHLENIVYVELRRRGAHVAYHITQAGHEVDFVVLEGDTPVELVQVCANLSDPATRERELRAIEGAARETGVRTATLVTLRDQGTVEVAGTQVHIEPAWRWLLRRPTDVRR